MTSIKVQFSFKRKWWLMPLMFFIGIFHKIIHKEPSKELTVWLSNAGFTMEQTSNES